MNFLIIHGMSGQHTDHWYPWLQDKLEQKGHYVINKTFPENLKTSKNITLDFARKLITDIDSKNLIIISHSAGSAVALRLAEQIKLKALIIVSGLFEDLGYKLEEKSGMFTGGFDWQAIITNVEQIIQIDSNNDPFIPTSHFAEMAELLCAKHITLPNRQHFGHNEDTPKEFPELLEVIERDLLGK